MTAEPETPPQPPSPQGPPPASPDVPGRSSPPRRRRRIWTRVLAVLVSLAVVVAIAGLFIPVSYVIIEPGDATPVSGAVSVKGAPTYPSRGSLLFLTVSVSNGKPNLWRYPRRLARRQRRGDLVPRLLRDDDTRAGPKAQRAGDGHLAADRDQGRAREARVHGHRDREGRAGAEGRQGRAGRGHVEARATSSPRSTVGR